MEQGLDGVKCCTRASGAGAAHRLPAGPAPRPVTHPGLRAPSRWPPKASWPWREAGGQRGEGTASRSPGPTEPVVGGQGQGVPGPDGSPGPGELGVWGWRVWGRLAGSWGRGWGRGAGAKAGTAGSGGGAGLRGGGGTFLGGGGGGGGPCDRLRPVLETKGAAAAGAGRARRGRERSSAGRERVSARGPGGRTAASAPPPQPTWGLDAGWGSELRPGLQTAPGGDASLRAPRRAARGQRPRVRRHRRTSPTPWAWKLGKGGGRSTPAAPDGDPDPCSPPRMQRRGFLLLALFALLALTDAVAKKKDKVKKGGPGSECAEWTWGPCTPSSKDCGVGFREGTCGAQTQRVRCRVPCNWKKEFGADCKYKFESWGACDGGTGTKARQGTLKKARYNAQCQETIRVTKPCTPKTKAKAKASFLTHSSPGGQQGRGGSAHFSAKKGKGKD
uniref:Midkine n=3 Tax=Sus scrofa TaxID=9823 RepID=A0A8D1IKI9_PIG